MSYQNCQLLRYMLANPRDLLDQVDDCTKFIPMLGEGTAELLSDAFQALLKENKFSCIHDHACAIIWAMCLDAHQANYFHEDCDVLRNGVLIDQLLAPGDDGSIVSFLQAALAPEGGENA